MKYESIWKQSVKRKNEQPLKNDIKVDVLIIGGGITGISTAYHLINSNLKIALVDKGLVGDGVTSRTTGKLTFLQELIYHQLESNISYQASKLYLESQQEAIKIVEEIIKKHNIDCDFNKVDSYTFTDDKKQINKFKKEEAFFDKAGIKYSIRRKLPIKMSCVYALKVKETAVFHAVKYVLKLKEICINNSIEIYENTRIISIEKDKQGYICKTKNDKIKAKKVVIACHYPFFIVPFFFPFKTYIEQSYLCALKQDEVKNFSAITNTYPTKSIRFHQDKYLIYVGESHNSCDNFNREEKFKQLLKNVSGKVEYCWSNNDVITNDRLPYIGRLSTKHPNLLIGTGYNTWGMTNGTIAGVILSDIILNKDNKYQSLFSPTRNINIYKLKTLPINLYSNILSFTKSKLIKDHSWYPNNVRFERENGNKIAVYIDEKGIEHKVHNKCPHAKCSLLFNEKEKTWDCPCHGSRYDIDGKLIQGPSKEDISLN